jgi:phosphoglycolate phosphatase
MPLVIFDLDGTLVDSRLDLANSTNEVLESYGAAPLPVDAIAAMVGEGARRLVQRAREAAGLRVPLEEALARFRAAYDRRLLEHTKPYAGIAHGVRAAGALARLAVLTNKPEAPTRRLLDAFALLESFDWVLGGDSGFPRKPNPSGVLHLMAQAGASAADTLFVGDSMIDVETARRAGVPICVARYGFGHLRGELELRGDELIASEPTDLPAIIARFAAGANERA